MGPLAGKYRIVAGALALTLACTLPTAAGCAASQASASEDLMAGVEPAASPIDQASLDGPGARGAADFAVALFQQNVAESDNVLVSPLSVLYALGMTANGADGETRAQMEEVLGASVDDLNAYLHAYDQTLAANAAAAAAPIADLDDMDAAEGAEGGTDDAEGGTEGGDAATGPLKLANALWIKNGFDVRQPFLQTNADHYGAGAFRAPFDQGTAGDINAWVNEHTDGMIESVLDDIPPEAVMYLVNALAFDATWVSPYDEGAVEEGTFTAADGTQQKAQMMSSTEDLYLEDGEAAGFVKPYREGSFAFVALLPPEGMSVQDYAATLTGERLQDILDDARPAAVQATMPKFESEFGTDLSTSLKALGMPDAFDPDVADFTRLSEDADALCIGSVLHKTHIAVDEQGTKAGAATVVGMSKMSAMGPDEEKTVCLDRPFVYLIVDQQANLPVFIGTLTTLE